MAKKSMRDLKVIQETETGRNEKFKDRTGQTLTRKQLVKEIHENKREGYIRIVNGEEIPCKMPKR